LGIKKKRTSNSYANLTFQVEPILVTWV